MKPITVGDVVVSSIIERDGPWRRPADMFPTSDPEVAQAHLRSLEPIVYDAATDMLVITYQTFIVRTARHTILIDTCVGQDKPNRGPKLDFSKQPWLDGFAAEGLPPAYRSLRLEPAAGGRPLGTDIPQCEIRLQPPRIRILGRGNLQGRRPARRRVVGFLPAHRRGRSGAAGR